MKSMFSKKLLLVILDGWGIGPQNEHNAIYIGKTPFFDSVWQKGARSVLTASGESVGLTKGQMGSSEVGHMHIGAGRLVLQELTRISKSLDDGAFYTNEPFITACEYAKEHKSALHLIGLLSDGGVHSHESHLYALITLAEAEGVPKIYVHAFLDGRDTPPASAARYLKRLEKNRGRAILATLSGRYYAMDRNQDWHLTASALDVLVHGKGKKRDNFNDALSESYKTGVYDEFVEPILLDENGLIRARDSIICFNLRADRMRQLVTVLYKAVPDIHITTMIPYGVENVPTHPAFTREAPERHLSQALSEAGIPHIKIAETQKYPHLTYFLNGTREEAYRGEERIMIPSKDVPRFDMAPEMSAEEITQAAIGQLGKLPVIMINYANADMVGHTGNLKAGVAAVECVDKQLYRLVEEARQQGYEVIITADHGNAEEMYDMTIDSAHTAHTTNPVPFVVISDKRYSLKENGSLTNVAPTVLEMLGIGKPREMVEGLFY